MVASSFSTRRVINPYAHPTALTVARALAPADSYINSNRPPVINMACQSNLRNGSIKSCKRRGGRSKFRYGNHHQRSVDGSRAFSQYRDCVICQVKLYSNNKIDSQKKKIRRGPAPGGNKSPNSNNGLSVVRPSSAFHALRRAAHSSILIVAAIPCLYTFCTNSGMFASLGGNSQVPKI